MYHLNIALESNGPEPNSGGYTYAQLSDVWLAANATKSNVMMMWYKPEITYQNFLHTDAEFTKVVLPPQTQECINARVSIADRCHPDPVVRRGAALGACDKDVQQLYKLISSNLAPLTDDDSIPEGKRSPAYDVVSLFSMTGEHLGQMFELWKQVHDPRDAVCTWVTENLELVRKSIPRTFPRTFVEKDEIAPLLHISIVLASVALVSAVITCAAVYELRERRVMRTSQVEFLWLLLAGLLCITAGALLAAVPPTDGVCISSMWLINVGYTLELVPLIIKVSLILQRQSLRMPSSSC